MAGHHLILGELVDCITGETIDDTHDERYRQKIARLLVNQKGYCTGDIEPRRKLLVEAGDKKAIVMIDFLIKRWDKVCMLIKYGPGSLVTRRRSVLAASRLVMPYQVPIAVITNGEDAEILEGTSGKVISQGLDTIPSLSELEKIIGNDQFKTIAKEKSEIESRIFYCYEVDGSCPCSEDICRL
jgi:hypothetical protein